MHLELDHANDGNNQDQDGKDPDARAPQAATELGDAKVFPFDLVGLRRLLHLDPLVVEHLLTKLLLLCAHATTAQVVHEASVATADVVRSQHQVHVMHGAERDVGVLDSAVVSALRRLLRSSVVFASFLDAVESLLEYLRAAENLLALILVLLLGISDALAEVRHVWILRLDNLNLLEPLEFVIVVVQLDELHSVVHVLLTERDVSDFIASDGLRVLSSVGAGSLLLMHEYHLEVAHKVRLEHVLVVAVGKVVRKMLDANSKVTHLNLLHLELLDVFFLTQAQDANEYEECDDDDQVK